MSTPIPTSWPAGFTSAPPPPRPVSMDNAINFGFKLAIGMTMWFVPFGIVTSIIVAILGAAVGHIH